MAILTIQRQSTWAAKAQSASAVRPWPSLRSVAGRVVLVIRHADQLATGGHYGGALFTPRSLATAQSAGQVGLHSSVAALVFLTTASGGTQSISLQHFSQAGLHFSLPSSTNVVLTNSGNTQVVPRGVISLHGPGSRLVSTTILNDDSAMILPGDHAYSAWPYPFGTTRSRCRASTGLQLRYRDDTASMFTTINKQFVYINPFTALVFAITIAVLSYALKVYAKRWLRLARHIFRRPPPPPAHKPKRPRLIQ